MINGGRPWSSEEIQHRKETSEIKEAFIIACRIRRNSSKPGWESKVATEVDTDASPVEARHEEGIIHVRLEDGAHLAFPVTLTERLSKASPAELAEIELLPFSLQWPLIDEDLSIERLLQLGYGD